MTDFQTKVDFEEILREFFYATDKPLNGRTRYIFDRRKDNSAEFTDMAEQLIEIATESLQASFRQQVYNQADDLVAEYAKGLIRGLHTRDHDLKIACKEAGLKQKQIKRLMAKLPPINHKKVTNQLMEK